MKARILLVDDHALVRTGIRRVLEETPEWTVCGEAEDGREAIQKALDLKPHVILMDVSMPHMNGIEATKQIRRLSPDARIIILSMHNAPQLAQQAKEAGANAYVVKASNVETLRQAVRTALATDAGEFTNEQ